MSSTGSRGARDRTARVRRAAAAVPNQDGHLGPGSVRQVRVEERPPRNLPADQAGGPVPDGPAADRDRLDVGVVIVEDPDVARPKIGVDHEFPRSDVRTLKAGASMADDRRVISF